jgi:hypothetical protein
MLSRSGALAVQASWRSWKTTRAILIGRCTPSAWRVAYVLHVFQKKSKGGIKTPKAEIDLIKSRLKRAEEEHARWLEAQKE